MKKLLLLSLMGLLVSCDSSIKTSHKRVSDSDIFVEAVEEGDYSTVKSYFNKMPKISKELALIEASEEGHTAIVNFLLESGVKADSMNNTPIFRASNRDHMGDHEEVVKLLIKYGADECKSVKVEYIKRPRLVDTIKRRIGCGFVDIQGNRTNYMSYYVGYETILYPNKIIYKDSVVKGMSLTDIEMLHSYAETMNEHFNNKQNELGTTP